MKEKTALLFREYAEYHRHPWNVYSHIVGIPLIVFHITAMLDWVTIFHVGGFPISLGMFAYLGVMLWYATLDAELTPVMAAWFGVCFPLGWMAPTWFVVTVAVVGWTTQLAGHLIWEKRSPAFLTNLKQALIGPLYFVHKVRCSLLGDEDSPTEPPAPPAGPSAN